MRRVYNPVVLLEADRRHATREGRRPVLTEVALAQAFEASVIDDSIEMAAVPLALNEIGLDAGAAPWRGATRSIPSRTFEYPSRLTAW